MKNIQTVNLRKLITKRFCFDKIGKNEKSNLFYRFPLTRQGKISSKVEETKKDLELNQRGFITFEPNN